MVASVVMRIDCLDSWMVARFPSPQRCLSWAVVNGGNVISNAVAWRFLSRDEVAEMSAEPEAWMRSGMERAGLSDAVGLMTSRRMGAHTASNCGVCQCVATVGMSNALAAGDPPRIASGLARPAAGTINLLCWVRSPLTLGASLEALALASEARAAAIIEAGIPSRMSGRPSTGTGTDCFVIACPPDGEPLPYCGKHTPLGHQIGAAVKQAVSRGVAEWLAEQPA
jgi:adenosylcobinamide amidohydrolase